MSESSVPITTTTSADSTSRCTRPKTRQLPAHNSWLDDITPLALPVSNTGASRAWANATSSLPALTQPPPAMTTRFCAELIISAARNISFGDAVGFVATSFFRANLAHGWARTSIGIAICTGRGRDELKTLKARSISAGKCSGSVTVSLNAHTDSAILA